MKVFNLFFRMVRNFKVQIAMFIGLSVLLILPIKNEVGTQLDANYDAKQVDVTIIDEDQGVVSEGLIHYLADKVNVVEVENTPQKRLDAIFFEETDYILEIPAGWTDRILSQETIPPFETQVGSDQQATATIETMLLTYVKSLEVSRLRLGVNPNAAKVKGLLSDLDDYLNGQVKMEQLQSSVDTDILVYGTYFQAFTIYSFIMIFVTVIGSIILSMRSPEVSKREWLGKNTEIKRTLQTWLASLCFAVIIWAFVQVIGIILFGTKVITDPKGLWIMLNSFICLLGVQSMAYFVAVVMPNKGMVSFMGNVLSLVLAFFSGLFVPIELVNKTAQSVVSIATPIWYIRTNQLILELKNYQWSDLSPIFQNLEIQLLIGVSFLGLSYMVQRHRLMNRIYLD